MRTCIAGCLFTLFAASQTLAQAILPDDRLSPPVLTPADSVERWYGDKPGEKRLRLEIRVNNSESALPGETYGHGQIFGNRTMQVVPILVIVDALVAKPGEAQPELDFSLLASGNLTAAKVEDAIFKIARPEAMAEGEPAVTISSPEAVWVDWGDLHYLARRFRLLINVQCQVRPRDGKPLPKPQPFAFQFSYSVSVRGVDGPREWRTAWSPPFGVTTNWTADSGPLVSLPSGRQALQPWRSGLASLFLLLTLGLFFWAFGADLSRRCRLSNRHHSVDPEEVFWRNILPLFEAGKQAGGYVLTRGDVYDIVISLKRFADARGAGTACGIRLSTSTVDQLERVKHSVVCGEELWRIIYPLEVSILREGRRLDPPVAGRLLQDLRSIVAGFPV